MISDILKNWCKSNSLEITEKQLSMFEAYAALLKEWNEKMNLTAITDDEGIAVKHFIDSISVLKTVELKPDSKLIDIGTGAGFPGIPIKIMRPDIDLTLLDSLNKRLVFLSEVCSKLEVNAEIIHARAEEFGHKPEFREKYDYSVSRAVANLPSLCEYCIPYIKVGGSFISMKGPEGDVEIEAAKNAVNTLGCKILKTDELILPDKNKRMIIQIKKISATPAKYPRRGVKISKQPL